MLEVHITKGMRNGQKITFHGEADEAPGVVPGDIIFIVEEKVQAVAVVVDSLVFRGSLGARPHRVAVLSLVSRLYFCAPATHTTTREE